MSQCYDRKLVGSKGKGRISKQVFKKKKKLYRPFSWMGFNCLKARATSQKFLVLILSTSEGWKAEKKTKHAKFSEQRTLLPPDTLTYVCESGGKKCSFFGKFGVLCFLETIVLRFALLPYYRQTVTGNYDRGVSGVVTYIKTLY